MQEQTVSEAILHDIDEIGRNHEIQSIEVVKVFPGTNHNLYMLYLNTRRGYRLARCAKCGCKYATYKDHACRTLESLKCAQMDCEGEYHWLPEGE